jgi:hypothetical protein
VRSTLRGIFALTVFTATTAVFAGPLGCLPPIPTAALPPMEAPPLEVPQAPELQVPEFTPPEIATPEGPDLPVQPPPSEGNCCIRSGNNLKKLCGGAMSCCTKEFDETGDCEAEKGFWFFTPEGCAGAC